MLDEPVRTTQSATSSHGEVSEEAREGAHQYPRHLMVYVDLRRFCNIPDLCHIV